MALPWTGSDESKKGKNTWTAAIRKALTLKDIHSELLNPECDKT